MCHPLEVPSRPTAPGGPLHRPVVSRAPVLGLNENQAAIAGPFKKKALHRCGWPDPARLLPSPAVATATPAPEPSFTLLSPG